MADEDEDESVQDDAGGLGGEAQPSPSRDWRRLWEGRTGWVTLAVIALLQGVFALVVIALKAGAKPVGSDPASQVRALAVEMLGREIALQQINQLVTGPNGRRMAIGLNLVLVLGQLPEERIVGAPRPTDEEFEAFRAAITDMEPRIRSRMNSLLQRIPYEEYASPDVAEGIKADMMQYVNDELDGLAFAAVRPGIGKRRITDILLPLFVRQPM